jgi:50S ribosomal protein L16 3-hydroxylase
MAHGTRTALLGGLTPAQFLARHWQRRPRLVRAAFPAFRDPLTPDELAGLACEADVESRLVLERGGARSWQVVPGPQDPHRLRRLPPTHWTLLVQGVDRHVPAVADLLDRFRFVPGWRLDDVMVSFAPRHGSVGPHVDSYDVFLLQGRGRRRWRIETDPVPRFRPGLDLRILETFAPEREWVLEPGDMLYLPPGVAHHGIALEECLTYSIGFRAPRHADLLARTLEDVVRGTGEAVYGEGRGKALGGRRVTNTGEIDRETIAALRTIVDTAVAGVRGARFDRVVGALLTEPKTGGPVPPRRKTNGAALRRRLAGAAVLVRSPATRMAFIRRGSGIDLFVDGRTIALSRALGFAARLLTGPRRIPAPALAARIASPGFAALLADLVNEGVFVLERVGGARSRGQRGREAPRARRARGGNRRAAGSRSRSGRP